MTHITHPGSKRDAILYAIDNLNPIELKECGTSADSLYKIANPNSGLNLDIELGGRLDAALTARGKACVFQGLLLKTFEEALGKRDVKAVEIETELLHVTAEVGSLAEAVTQAAQDKVWTPAEGRGVAAKATSLIRRATVVRDAANGIAGPQIKAVDTAK